MPPFQGYSRPTSVHSEQATPRSRSWGFDTSNQSKYSPLQLFGRALTVTSANVNHVVLMVGQYAVSSDARATERTYPQLVVNLDGRGRSTKGGAAGLIEQCFALQ